MNLTTSEIKITTKKLIMTLFLEYGIVWISVAMIIPFVLAIFGMCYDYRFFILILIWIFIIIPLSFFLLFVFYGMHPLTTYNSINHTITFNDNNLNIDLIFEEGENKKHKTILIDYSNLEKIKTSTDSLVLFFKKPSSGLLFIPYESLENKETIEYVVQKLKRQ